MYARHKNKLKLMSKRNINEFEHKIPMNMNINDLTRVFILYEMYQKSLRQVSYIPYVMNTYVRFY